MWVTMCITHPHKGGCSLRCKPRVYSRLSMRSTQHEILLYTRWVN